ncbi:MAG: hypothetical protein ACYSW4_08345 [Planctomycetota bacterium]|jgi:hypothetical protein
MGLVSGSKCSPRRSQIPVAKAHPEYYEPGAEKEFGQGYIPGLAELRVSCDFSILRLTSLSRGLIQGFTDQ